MGVGTGSGRHNNEGGIVAGSVISAGLAICCCAVGIPVIFAGIILIAVSKSGTGPWNIGLALLIISLAILVGGIVIIILLCSGVFEKKQQSTAVGPASIHTTTVVQPPAYTVAMGNPGMAYPQPGYQGNTAYAQPYMVAPSQAPVNPSQPTAPLQPAHYQPPPAAAPAAPAADAMYGGPSAGHAGQPPPYKANDY